MSVGRDGDGNLRMLLWHVDATTGFDSAYVSLRAGGLGAEGRIAALQPYPHWLTYSLETGDDFVTRRMAVDVRREDGAAVLDLRLDGGIWTVDGNPRPDLDGALDCDLGGCPLTNTMPILRHDLHRSPGNHEFAMAFIEVPSLIVRRSVQRYTHLHRTEDGGAVIKFSSGRFESDISVDSDGFVVDYPKLGSRVERQRHS